MTISHSGLLFLGHPVDFLSYVNVSKHKLVLYIVCLLQNVTLSTTVLEATIWVKLCDKSLIEFPEKEKSESNKRSHVCHLLSSNVERQSGIQI